MNRKNNFDFLRFLFASFVIISHSYPLSGEQSGDWLHTLTGGQLYFSDIGLKGFFVISGYLIFQSLQRSSSLLNYFWKRALRIFPALFVVLIITVLLAPFVYDHSISYLSNPTVWSYIPNNLMMYPMQFCIEGVFEGNPYNSAINGSLWTIPHEFTLYVVLSFMFIIRKNNQKLLFVLVPLFIASVIGVLFFKDQLNETTFYLNAFNFTEFTVFFFAGSILGAVNFQDSKYIKHIIIACTCIIILSLFFKVYTYASMFAFPALILALATRSTPYINAIGERVGDLSYGIYIIAFPVQQALVYLFDINYLTLMLLSWLITVILAYFSWHYVESKALALKSLPFQSRKRQK